MLNIRLSTYRGSNKCDQVYSYIQLYDEFVVHVIRRMIALLYSNITRM